MKRAVMITTMFLMVSTIALPAQADFRSLAKEISMNSDLERVWIPFMGVGRIFVRMAHPDGIRDVRLAVFETRRGAAAVDLEPLVRRHVDLDRWSEMIRSSSRGENTHVFVQERGDNIGLFIAASDGDEVVIIEVELDAERFAREIDGDADFTSLGRRR